MQTSVKEFNSIIDEYQDLVSRCNADSGYPHSQACAEDMSMLKGIWSVDCPGLEHPSVDYSNEKGAYVLSNLSTPKPRNRETTPR